MSTALSRNHQHGTQMHTVARRQDTLEQIIADCARRISPVWPLETFIACNPLQGCESEPFDLAFLKATKKHAFEEKAAREGVTRVNTRMIKWCAAFLDAGQATIRAPGFENGFYSGFKRLAPFDTMLHNSNKASISWLENLPESPIACIRICLDLLSVSSAETRSFIEDSLDYLPGWAGHIQWRDAWSKADETHSGLTDFLAVRLVITALSWPEAVQEVRSRKRSLNATNSVLEQIETLEKGYFDSLVPALVQQINHLPSPHKRPDAQLVFCIDVRSERIRREIEKTGHYKTLGFAGFFGLPVRIHAHHHETRRDCCPVLLKPRHDISEKPVFQDAVSEQRYRLGNTLIRRLKKTFSDLKYHFSTPFVLAEFLGFWCGFRMLGRSISPVLDNTFTRALKKFLGQEPETRVLFEQDRSHEKMAGMSVSEQADYAENILRGMGLSHGFGKLILLCGHGSTTTNNPFASALDCGACGGNHGFTNAKTVAAILNKPRIRRLLEERGIHVPLDTVFLGALHDTTTDGFEIAMCESSQMIYPEIMKKLRDDLEKAGIACNLKRGEELGSSNPLQDIPRRSIDWSETRPEWGLAKNAAFIAAPRALTEKLDLGGRCFLHSYDWENDPDGSIMETILTAPMVVAQWINAQYLFSTIDNAAWGSGSKITQNVVGKLGVMQGNGSDLMHGLPRQSVMSNDQIFYHQPQRLLSVIHANPALVCGIIQKHANLQNLIFNRWIHLVIIEPKTGICYEPVRKGDEVAAEKRELPGSGGSH